MEVDKSIDIFEIPLYYIDLRKNNKLEFELENIGFKNINFFQAVNGRKLDIKKLREDGIITIRSYNDLLNNREQRSGLSSLGAVGCTLSHYFLWQKCVKDNLNYIIIVENDVDLKKIAEKELKDIQKILSKPKSGFISTVIKKDNNIYDLIGLQFNIFSNDLCKELVKDALPIDVQTDHYIAHLKTLNNLNVEGFNLFGQKKHKSSIQDSCFKCELPKNNIFYIIIFIIFILIIIGLVLYFYKYIKCKKSCGI
jgi:GR25 family glycosyltransferase involved in LPS biosynthesis